MGQTNSHRLLTHNSKMVRNFNKTHFVVPLANKPPRPCSAAPPRRKVVATLSLGGDASGSGNIMESVVFALQCK